MPPIPLTLAPSTCPRSFKIGQPQESNWEMEELTSEGWANDLAAVNGDEDYQQAEHQ